MSAKVGHKKNWRSEKKGIWKKRSALLLLLLLRVLCFFVDHVEDQLCDFASFNDQIDDAIARIKAFQWLNNKKITAIDPFLIKM